jgi:hypothetical protein
VHYCFRNLQFDPNSVAPKRGNDSGQRVDMDAVEQVLYSRSPVLRAGTRPKLLADNCVIEGAITRIGQRGMRVVSNEYALLW